MISGYDIDNIDKKINLTEFNRPVFISKSSPKRREDRYSSPPVIILRGEMPATITSSRLVKCCVFLLFFNIQDRVTAITSGSTMTIPPLSDYASNNTYEGNVNEQLGQQPVDTNSKNSNVISDDYDEKIMTNDLITLDPRISTLRSMGRSLLSAKEYVKAVDCYAVVLQLMQGCGGEESDELRRRCSLTLAECHLQLENFEDAVSRCSDVIEEAPEVTGADNTALTQDWKAVKKIKLALAKAYYRRALALNRLGKSHFALVDLEKALELSPLDAKVLRSMDLIKQERAVENGDTSDSSEEGFNIELFRDYIEESQIRCTLKSYNDGQMRAIIAGMHLSSPVSGSRPPAPVSRTMASMGAADNNLLGSLLGSGSKGGELLSSLGGLGGLGSLVGMAGGGANMDVVAMIDGVTRFTPMLKTIGLANGMDAGLVSQCTEIFKALAEMLKRFIKGYLFLKANVNQIVFILTGLWIFIGISDWMNRKT